MNNKWLNDCTVIYGEHHAESFIESAERLSVHQKWWNSPQSGTNLPNRIIVGCYKG